VSLAAGRRAHAAIGWLLLILLLGWTACVHHGVGPEKLGLDDRWYTPRAFLLEYESTGGLLASPALAFTLLCAPALVLAVAASLATGSALAGALAASCVLATALFTFYGTRAPLPWDFFGWRGSAVLCSVAAVSGTALAAPWLARSWLRLPRALRIAVYAPLVILVVVLLRNVTGTNEKLSFAISPWPALTVFGIEVGALGVAIVLAGAALAAFGATRARARGSERPAAALAFAAGMLVPLALLQAGSWLGLFPFHVGAGLVTAFTLATAALVAVSLWRTHESSALRPRLLALAALLLGAPVLLGQAWAWLDYQRTREGRAREIIDALQVYVEREGLYPDELSQLVDAKLLARIPEPSIGFQLGDGVDSFDYASYGTSYLLDFSAPRWVQCHYTPAPILDDLDEEERAELAAEGGLEESWSCPSTPPELW
jgi:hypothetical protein